MGLCIFLTLGAAAVILHATGSEAPHDQRVEDVQAFFSQQFAESWHDPAERSRLAERTAAAFHVGLELNDAQGKSLGRFGRNCHGPQWNMPISEGSAELGSIDVCTGAFKKSHLFVGLAAAGLVCWLFAGFIAHRLGSPLVRLADVADEIGRGKLSSRARLGRHLAGEVGHLAQSINEMAERIERQMKGQRELLAGVSHEIRTPLSRLRVLTEILRDKNVDEGALIQVEREIDEINDLTGQLLASSRLEFESIDAVPLVASEVARSALERASLPNDLLQVTGDPISVTGDATLLGRALSNLVENAKHHGKGLTALIVEYKGDLVAFTAQDRGPGFQEEDLPKAFQSFFRGKGSGKGTSSLGLGLSLVRRIARAHGGDAFAENLAGGGAAVTFTVAAAGAGAV